MRRQRRIAEILRPNLSANLSAGGYAVLPAGSSAVQQKLIDSPFFDKVIPHPTTTNGGVDQQPVFPTPPFDNGTLPMVNTGIVPPANAGGNNASVDIDTGGVMSWVKENPVLSGLLILGVGILIYKMSKGK